MTNDVIILAGGKGTRLRSEIGEHPKVLALVNGRPFLEYLLDYLIDQGISRAILSVGYKWEMIQEHFGDKYDSMELIYSVENDPLGTGGGIRLALEKCESDDIIAINGDTYFNIDLNDLLTFHKENSADCSIALKRMTNSSRYGNVVLDNDQIKRFEEKKQQDSALINGGIYVISKKALTVFATNKVFSFESDYLQKNTSDKAIYGKVFDRYFMDIGIPEDYNQFQKDMLS